MMVVVLIGNSTPCFNLKERPDKDVIPNGYSSLIGDKTAQGSPETYNND